MLTQLQRLIGKPALELVLTGRIISAGEARTLDMINRVVPDDQALEQALALAHQMAGQSVTAMRLTRDLFFQTRGMDYRQALQAARDANVVMRYSADFKQGALDFAKARRTPVSTRSCDGGAL